MLESNTLKRIEYLCNHRGLLEIEILLIKFFNENQKEIINYDKNQEKELFNILNLDDNLFLRELNGLKGVDLSISKTEVFSKIKEYYKK